ncbi:antibiotic biosynthesis monooxygenase [Micromonospora sp. D93]|uniref:antibiotic biosynthesis monooxygenase family protein n=1 Tax=Micromonospora sp. D93 TaxID=2824886 RepID=UPI001B35C6D9|nr:antibiotic biosynthesis monooxygenase [Micromonospora sp. D93]MBQ1020187.1 antibiotic biosynthesis monooxygenase [Micromonospora sp. D93]
MTSVFTVTEQHQAQLYALLAANGQDVLEHTPGFLGSTLTRSDDGRHVIHHARWRDDDALGAMLASPGGRSSMAASRLLADVKTFRSHHSQAFEAS